MADRPLPKVTVDDWNADPDSALGTTMEIVKALFEAAESFGFWGWVVAIAAGIWTSGKFLVPTWGRVIGDLFFKFFAAKQDRQHDEKVYQVGDFGIDLLETINESPELKALMLKVLDEDQQAELLIRLKKLRDEKKAA